MKDLFKGVGIVLGLIIAFMLIGWAIYGNGFFMYKYFAPKEEQVRREVFEQSKAYNQGMVQELQNMQFEYEKADSSHKTALASIILHRAADYDENKLPTDLYEFIQKLKKEKRGKSGY